jgi:hypothetical protein
MKMPTPVYISSGNAVYRHDVQGPVRRPFPNCPGNVAVAAGGGWLYEATDWWGVTVQKTRLGADGWPVGEPAKRKLAERIYLTSTLSMVVGEHGVFVSGGAETFHLGHDLTERARISLPHVMTVATTFPDRSPAPPVVFGSGDRWMVIWFEGLKFSAQEQANICQAVAEQCERWGVPLKVSNGRPPASPRYLPGEYGTVRVVPQDRWFWGGSGAATVGSWTVNGLYPNPPRETERPAWAVESDVDQVVRCILHEGIGHSLGGLPDLHTIGLPGGGPGPVGRLMSAYRPDGWQRNVGLTSGELNAIKAGWLGMVGPGR